MTPTFGARVRLNSGGPPMLVVDIIDSETIVAATPDGETVLPWVCVETEE